MDPLDFTEKETESDTTFEYRDSVLGLLHQTAELLDKKGEREMAKTYLEAALNCFCCWESTYVPKRTSEGKLVWNTSATCPQSEQSTTAQPQPQNQIQ